jgi:hypothetical protein
VGIATPQACRTVVVVLDDVVDVVVAVGAVAVLGVVVDDVVELDVDELDDEPLGKDVLDEVVLGVVVEGDVLVEGEVVELDEELVDDDVVDEVDVVGLVVDVVVVHGIIELSGLSGSHRRMLTGGVKLPVGPFFWTWSVSGAKQSKGMRNASIVGVTATSG